MKSTVLIVGILAFLSGWLVADLTSWVSAESISAQSNITQQNPSDDKTKIDLMNFEALKEPINEEPRDKPSPANRVTYDNIHVYEDKVILDINDPQWAIFADTKSMDPVIDSSSKAIEITPKSPFELQIGDIVAYDSEYADGTIIHRILSIGNDEKGWYATMKGDNNKDADPGKVRFSQIKRVVVAVIY